MALVLVAPITVNLQILLNNGFPFLLSELSLSLHHIWPSLNRKPLSSSELSPWLSFPSEPPSTDVFLVL